MLKTKKVLILGLLLLVLLIVPTMVNAATEYTYSDTNQGIEWTYELDKEGSVVNLKCKTTSVIGNITIPSTIEGKKVISLGTIDYQDGAFENCAGLTGITIPNTITRIGIRAFSKCTGLKTVTIPDSVTSISSSAFMGCTGLTTVTLSKNLTSIGSSAFSGCSGLKSISIPDSVTMIGTYAFDDCSGLKELKLSEHLTKIDECVFENCSGLTSVIIPSSVTTISGRYGMYGAFNSCTNLEKILIPDTVASIGNAFSGCKKLTIYGNDGQTSKEYAEANDINFDYIANWNKANSGADITPPTVEKIQVKYASVMSYWKDTNKGMYMVPSGAKLIINVGFNEAVDGNTIPTLTIKFGEGQNIELKEGSVGGSVITYIYTVKNTDKGIMSTVSFSGGNIKDAAGNAAKLSCPKLSIDAGGSDIVYANGTATNPDNGGNNNNNTTNKPSDSNNSTNNNTNNNTNKPSNNNTNNNKPSNNTQNTDKDNTKAPTKLPQTGEGIMIMLAVVTIAGIGVFAYMKYNKYRDI